MKNVFFPDEDVTKDDLFFVCYMIERVARHLKQRNKYVVNSIGRAELERQLSMADVQHCENPLAVVERWVEQYNLQSGNFDILDVSPEYVTSPPTALQIGKMYARLIGDTMNSSENFADGIIRIYNNPLCEIVDNYNCGAYYEPSYCIARAFCQGYF